MPVYQYEGKHYDLPTGLTNEQAIAKIESFLGKTPAPQAAPAATEASIPSQSSKAPEPSSEPPSILSQMFGLGSPIARVAKGAVVDPLLAVNQILANTGLFGKDIKQGANQLVNQYEQATTQARSDMGSTGFDPFQLAGAVVSPVNKLASAGAATGFGNRLKQATSIGALQGGLQTVDTSKGQDFTGDKATQVALGAALGPVVEGGVSAIGAVASAFKGMSSEARTTYLRTQLNEMAGPARERVIEALRDAKELVTGSRPTAAEVLADVPTAAALAAAQKKIAKDPKLGGAFAAREAEQQAARQAAIGDIAGTEAQRAALVAERNAVTGATREQALNQSDLAAPVYTRLEKEVADGFNSIAAASQTAGMTGMAAKNKQQIAMEGKPGWLSAGDIAAEAEKTSSAYANKAETLRANVKLKQYQLDSLAENGFFPLKASDLVGQLDAAIKGTASDVSKSVLTFARDKILSKADENGILSSRDMYENVRKTLNQDIESFLQQGQKFGQGGLPEQAAKAAVNVKALIDASLNKSSDNLWSKYLTDYQKYSQKINRMEVGDFLSKQFNTPLDKERAGVFANAVQNAAGTIKKSTGIPRYDNLGQVLTEKELGTVNSVLADLMRSRKADELAAKVSNLKTDLPDPTAKVPSFLSVALTGMKAALRFFQEGNQAAYDAQMAKLLLDPPALAKFMTEAIPPSKMESFTAALYGRMSEPTKQAFRSAFIVPTVAREATGQGQE